MRLGFLALATAYLGAVAFGIAFFFVDERDAFAAVPAVLVTLPWSVGAAALFPHAWAAWSREGLAVLFGLAGVANVALLAVLFRRLRGAARGDGRTAPGGNKMGG